MKELSYFVMFQKGYEDVLKPTNTQDFPLGSGKLGGQSLPGEIFKILVGGLKVFHLRIHKINTAGRKLFKELLNIDSFCLKF